VRVALTLLCDYEAECHRKQDEQEENSGSDEDATIYCGPPMAGIRIIEREANGSQGPTGHRYYAVPYAVRCRKRSIEDDRSNACEENSGACIGHRSRDDRRAFPRARGPDARKPRREAEISCSDERTYGADDSHLDPTNARADCRSNSSTVQDAVAIPGATAGVVLSVT
jgi:hypothetical protein